jgi:hypothetical protein
VLQKYSFIVTQSKVLSLVTFYVEIALVGIEAGIKDPWMLQALPSRKPLTGIHLSRVMCVCVCVCVGGVGLSISVGLRRDPLAHMSGVG